jgi:hypothetical protein
MCTAGSPNFQEGWEDMMKKKRFYPFSFVVAMVFTLASLTTFVPHGLSQTAGKSQPEGRSRSEPPQSGNFYEVVSPISQETKKETPLSPRLVDLSGKTVCALSNYVFQHKVTFPVIAEDLKRSYTGLKFISFTEFPDTHDETDSGKKAMANIARLLKEKGCQAVISGNGG